MRNTSSSVTSVKTLTPQQKDFILGGGVSPKDRDGVQILARRFNGQFAVGVRWKTMRCVLTNLARKKRRNGGSKE